ncbi:MAG: YhbY family RNA-binding protein [Desulfobacterales bacterium]|nr:YhbY family RNA-binding protein [Desulfobacterales bacterium]MCP4158839.1 YhbY family RNA-binding protein [Deltaproteobacteria bacterium]
MELKGFQRKYLRGLAHGCDPLVIIGQKGVTDALIDSVEEALVSHELIKIRFNDFKEKDQKNEINGIIQKRCKCEMVGMIGHIAIFFRQNDKKEDRVIKIPKK